MRYIALGLLLSLLSSCQLQAHDVKETRFLLGTIVAFTIFTTDEKKALAAISQAAEVMQKVEHKFTVFGDVNNSVKAFNQAKVDESVVLDAEVEQLLLQAIAIHEQTLGGFDPTLGALNQLWGFSGENISKTPPSKGSVEQALYQSGLSNIKKVSTGWIKKVDGLKLDFGAIAKGYAIDKGVVMLKEHGFTQVIVNAGGDMRILGSHGDEPWRIAIRDPRQKEAMGWLEVNEDVSVVTSGDYERFYIYQGQRYHHILNPKTGYPAKASRSVTVLAKSATLADAWSTGLFVGGVTADTRLPKNLDVFWVGASGSLYQSLGFRLLH